ncbi:hypothetical protein LG329_19545 (plasmid) [Virgibacillus necropolis]|uniref:hypothetical protein n=1 Tax=Virgibacillus necropolis TaxID=163877 RepID=UPI00384B727B
MYKVGIILNDEVDNLVKKRADIMGTSKRNVISLALTDILDENIKREYLDQLSETITGLKIPLVITVSEGLHKKIKEFNRRGYSIRVFLGLLICDYYYKNYSFLTDNKHESINRIHEKSREYIKPAIDSEVKKKIVKYCNENSFTINSLFAQYILEKDLVVREYEIKEEALLRLNFSNELKKKIDIKINEMSINYRTYLNLIATQICLDLNL